MRDDAKHTLVGHLVGHATYEIIRWSFFTAFAYCAAKLASALSSKSSTFAPYTGTIFALAFAASGTLAIIAYAYAKRRRPLFPSDFRILKKSITYNYVSPTEISYQRHHELVTLRNNVDHYTDKYHWTGGGTVDVAVEDNEQRIQLTHRRNIWQFFDIILPKTCHKGEQVDITVNWRLKDPNRVAVPFISTTIDEPTGLLLFAVTFAKSLGVKQIVCIDAPDIAAKQEFESHFIKLDANGSATWEIPQPKLHHYYEVKWTPHEQQT